MLTGKWQTLRLLIFAFLLTFLSGFGQTFFIGLFSENIRDAVQLDFAGFGSLYAAATLTSAAAMFWAGALIDRVPLPLFTGAAVLLLGLGCVFMTQAETIWMIGASLFLLRLAGQGLFSHTALTSVARFFHYGRGKALSVAFLGHPAGEAVLPPLVVALGASFDWRTLWLGAAAVLLLVLPALLLLSRQRTLPQSSQDHGEARAGHAGSNKDVTRKAVLGDMYFYMILPTLLMPAFTVTGIFIHQTALVDEKGWALSWFAANFLAFAGAQVAGNLTAGQLVDRFTGRRLMPFYLLPLAAACVLINLSSHPLIATPFMIGAGLTNGAASAITNAMWAEVYGLRHLGAIRALASSIMVLSTALAPAIFGFLIEFAIAFDLILLGCAAFIGVAAFAARAAVKRKGPAGAH